MDSYTDFPIITYHQIVEHEQPNDHWNLSVSASRFERQMQYLHKHDYRCVSLVQHINQLQNDRAFKKKNIVLTFDDGYENFLTLAYPILRRYGFTATVFLITDYVGKQSDREFEKGVPFLDWDQAKSLHNDGISFGSHTHTHPDLLDLSEEQVLDEFVLSKERLQEKLGVCAKLLAYPHGHSNVTIQQLAEEAGYAAACGIGRGKRSRFNLWRTQCHTNDTFLNFWLQLTKWPYYARHFREETVLGQSIRTIKQKLHHFL